MNTITTVESIAELTAIQSPIDGQTVYVKSYHAGLGKGGGEFSYVSSRASENDNGIVINGWVRFNSDVVSPEMFGAKANDLSFDNTDVLNNAFATGADIHSTPEQTYYVTKNLRTKGQKLRGGWKIHSKKLTSRKGVWEEIVKVNDDGLDVSNNIQMMYVSSAWDLSEFLAIKNLGYNMIHHYVGMSQIGWDLDGNVFDVLNNAMSAGLKISLGIEQAPEAINNLDAWIGSVDSYPALWAYSVIDEPVSRGFSIEQQDEKISKMRSLTKKTLFTVDWMSNAFEQKYSKNYDLVLVNSYSMKYSGDSSIWFDKDLSKFRKDYGIIKSQIGSSVKIIPCLSMFTFSTSSNFFSDNLEQIVKGSEYFSKVSNADYASFVWDGEADASITGSVRDTLEFRKLSIRISKQPKLNLKTAVLKFGGVSTVQSDWGISEIVNHVLNRDPYSTDIFAGNAAYPIVLRKGDIDSDRTIIDRQTNDTVSGIGFKTSSGRIVTDITAPKNLRIVLEAFSPTNVIAGDFTIFTTKDGGYTYTDRFDVGVNDNTLIDYNIPLDSSYGTLIFQLNDSNNPLFYRNFLRGVIILADW